MHSTQLPLWPFAYGGPSGRGIIRTFPEDFIVKEVLGFEPSGAGEHVFLEVEKIGENTEYVARQLARFAGVRQQDVGYAGLKDRHAVTTQWFSVWLPGQRDPVWSEFESDTVKVLQAHRHARKLKRGVLVGNAFELLIRDWHGDKARLTEQLTAIKTSGMPNYFGEQRFGYQGQNIAKALALFAGSIKLKREQRGLCLSAARSYLFNQILARRIASQNWNHAIAGDAFVFDASHGYFKNAEIDTDIIQRVAALEIHPTGVLWGNGAVEVSAEALVIETGVIANEPELAQGLLDFGLESDRRALRVKVLGLLWHFSKAGELQLSFTLPAGSYATALLREIIEQI